MRSIHRILMSVAGLAIAPAAPAVLAAQTAASAPGPALHVTPYVGYMVFGDYLKGPLGTSLTNAPGPVYGTQADFALTPNLSLVGNVGYAATNMQVGVPFLGGISVGHSSMLIYDGGLEYRLGSGKAGTMPLTPFVQGGVGAIHYNINESVLSTTATNFAGNVGVGADIALSRGVGLRLLAKDYIGNFNFQGATGLNISGQTAHNFAFTAGLRFDF